MMDTAQKAAFPDKGILLASLLCNCRLLGGLLSPLVVCPQQEGIDASAWSTLLLEEHGLDHLVSIERVVRFPFCTYTYDYWF